MTTLPGTLKRTPGSTVNDTPSPETAEWIAGWPAWKSRLRLEVK